MADSSSPVGASSPPPATDTPVNNNNDDDDEDLMANLADDYKFDPSQDIYEEKDIDDDGDYDELTIGQRRQVEQELNRRDRRMGRRVRRDLPQALIGDNDDDDLPSELLQQREEFAYPDSDDGDDEIGLVNLEDFQGPLREWLSEPRVIKEVQNRFKNFLINFMDGSGTAIYLGKIAKMCQENKASLDVHYNHLANFEAILGIWVADIPSKVLKIFDEVLMKVVKKTFPNYDKIHAKVHCRISGLAIQDELRELRQLHLNAFVKVNGVVTRRTNIFPQLNLVKFDCLKCGFIIGPFGIKDQLNGKGIKDIKPNICPDCQTKGPFKLNETQTIYNNYQKIVLQESPGSVPAGRIPRSRDVILIDDLCDSVRPGEQIQVTGIYKNIYDIGMNISNGFPVFSTIIEANHILKEKDFLTSFEISDDDKQLILKLSKKMDIEKIILNSVAPSIYGYEYIKRSILYSLLGGQEKKHDNKHRVRGDINILILGDPGCGKSQFLKYIEKISSRSVYATGKGASAVGLTASVHRDPLTKEWTLEGGALVLADKGICLIDEFDKMNDSDRTSIHEAMEQQSISISKAGIVASLQARCAVIAAANPLKGRYDGSLTFIENIDLTDPILSRFDVLAVVRDKVEPTRDEKLAEFVVDNHIRSHPDNMVDTNSNNDENNEHNDSNNSNGNGKKKSNDNDDAKDSDELSQEFLRKYIIYAKKNCFPKLDNINREKIASFYSELRQKSMTGGGIPIAVRHIESILRLSEARARLHLREYVNDEDVNMAIKIILQSFISTQKQSIQSSLNKHFGRYLRFDSDSISLLMHLLNHEVNEELSWKNVQKRPFQTNVDNVVDDDVFDDDLEYITIDMKSIKDKATQLGLTNLQPFFKSKQFKNAGFTLINNGKAIKKTFK